MAEANRFSVGLPGAIAELATDLAEREQRTVSSLLAFAVESWLHANYSQRLALYARTRPPESSCE